MEREGELERQRAMGTVGAAAEVIRLVSNSYCLPRFGCHSFGRLFVVLQDQKMYRAMCLLQIAQNNNCKHFKKWVRTAKAVPTLSKSKYKCLVI